MVGYFLQCTYTTNRYGKKIDKWQILQFSLDFMVAKQNKNNYKLKVKDIKYFSWVKLFISLVCKLLYF